MSVHKLVLLRHGQSQWNLENRFTGWVDVDLTDQGRTEARNAGAAHALTQFLRRQFGVVRMRRPFRLRQGPVFTIGFQMREAIQQHGWLFAEE